MHSDKIEVRMVRVCVIVWKKKASGTISYLQKIQNQASGAACYGMFHLHVSNCRAHKFYLHNQDQLGLFSKFVGRLIDLLNLLVYDKFHNKVLESIFYEDF